MQEQISLQLDIIQSKQNTVVVQQVIIFQLYYSDTSLNTLSCRAPLGCDKYMMDIEGKITSYNFYRNAGTTQAANAQNSGVELGLQR